MRARIDVPVGRTRTAVVIALAMAAAAASPSAQTLTYAGALQGATGNYIFSQRTTTASLTNGLTLGAGRLTLSASVPLLYQSTPWVSQSGAGMIPTGGPESGTAHGGKGGGGTMAAMSVVNAARIVMPDTAQFDKAGVGDPAAFASLRLVNDGVGVPAIHVTGAVKFPVASVRSGFGTGEWDYGAGAGLSKQLGAMFVAADVMYWWLGDMPDLAFRNPVTFAGTVSRLVAHDRYAVYANAWGSTKSLADIEAPAQVGAGVCRMQSGLCVLGFGLSFGLTSSSPDLSATINWQVPLLRAR